GTSRGAASSTTCGPRRDLPRERAARRFPNGIPSGRTEGRQSSPLRRPKRARARDRTPFPRPISRGGRRSLARLTLLLLRLAEELLDALRRQIAEALEVALGRHRARRRGIEQRETLLRLHQEVSRCRGGLALQPQHEARETVFGLGFVALGEQDAGCVVLAPALEHALIGL